MGVETALIVGALGAGASAYNTYNTARKQDNEVARQIRAQSQLQDQANQRVAQAITEQATSSPDDERQASLDSYLKQLSKTSGNATNGLNAVGAVSDRYTSDADAAAGDIASTGQTTADIMSRIDAPVRQRQNEGISFGRLASDIDRLGQKSASQDYIGQLRLNSIQRNPWLDAAATAASIYGMTGGLSGGGLMGASSGTAGMQTINNQLSNSAMTRLLASGGYI
jgi:hypothetical protein